MVLDAQAVVVGKLREKGLMPYLLVEVVPDAASGGGKAALGWDKAEIQVLWGALVFEQ